MSAETMDGGKLTNKAGRLLKNRGDGRSAVHHWCIIAIATRRPKPEVSDQKPKS